MAWGPRLPRQACLPKAPENAFQVDTRPQQAKLEHMPDAPTLVPAKGKLSIKIVQYNAQSMIGDNTKTASKCDISSKGALVRAQLHERGIHIAGIQEARLKEAI